MPDDSLTLSGATAPALAHPHLHVPFTLMDLPIGTPARVRGLRPGDSHDKRELTQRLLEIGFVDGEPVRIVACGHPGREPVAVRIGGTTFALRRFEAERVLVELDSTAVHHA
jgi:ferrous iron transport protein A